MGQPSHFGGQCGGDRPVSAHCGRDYGAEAANSVARRSAMSARGVACITTDPPPRTSPLNPILMLGGA